MNFIYVMIIVLVFPMGVISKTDTNGRYCKNISNYVFFTK